MKPGFFVIPQNGEALLDDANYRFAIDGLGKESLLHGASATAKRNAREDIQSSLDLMSWLQYERKPVFAVEYLLDARHIAATASELRHLKIVPTFQTRGLDGGDPTAPVDLKTEIGTPERTLKDCPPGTSW